MVGGRLQTVGLGIRQESRIQTITAGKDGVELERADVERASALVPGCAAVLGVSSLQLCTQALPCSSREGLRKHLGHTDQDRIFFFFYCTENKTFESL